MLLLFPCLGPVALTPAPNMLQLVQVRGAISKEDEIPETNCDDLVHSICSSSKFPKLPSLKLT